MPQARSHTQAARATRGEEDPRATTSRPRPQRVSRTLPTSKVRWDRKFRAVMALVFVLVGWIGVKAGLALISAHAQAEHELHLVSTLSKSNHRLEARAHALRQRSTIIQEARALGMVQAGERPYVIIHKH